MPHQQHFEFLSESLDMNITRLSSKTMQKPEMQAVINVGSFPSCLVQKADCPRYPLNRFIKQHQLSNHARRTLVRQFSTVI